MSNINFFKVNSLPNTLKPNSVYFVNTAGRVITYITDNTGTITKEVSRGNLSVSDIPFALDKRGDSMTGYLTLNADPTDNLHAVTKQYVDSQTSSNLPVGSIIVSSQDFTPSGFLKCNGSSILASRFPDLASTLYNKTNSINYGAGRAWEQQYYLNNSDIVNNFTFTTTTALGTATSNHEVCAVDSSSVLLIGGNTTNTSTFSSTVTLVRVNTSGLVSSYTTLTNNALPVGLARHSIVTYGKWVYVIGGQSSTDVVNTVYRAYWNSDTSTLSNWELISNLPYNVANHKTLIINNRIYVIGGNDSVNTVTSNIISADIKEDGSLGLWTLSGNLPFAGKGFHIAIIKDKIYILGCNTNTGINRLTSTNAAYVTDLEFKEWRQLPNLPSVMSHGCCYVTNKYLLIVSPYTTTASRLVYKAEIYSDGALGNLIQTSLLYPAAIFNVRFFQLRDKLYFIGGNTSAGNTSARVYYMNITNFPITYNNKYLKDINVLNHDGSPYRNQFTFNNSITSSLNFINSGVNLNIAVHSAQSIVTNNYVYVIGGATNGGGSTCTNRVVRYTLDSSSNLTSPTNTTLPTNLCYHLSLMTKSFVYLIGGFNGSSYLNTIYNAPINADGTLGTWTASTTTLPANIVLPGTVFIKDSIYVMGGNTSSNVPLDTIYRSEVGLNGNLNSWLLTGKLPTPLYAFKPIVIGDRLYIIGGTTTDNIKSNKVYWCQIEKDGTLGEFKEYTSFPTTITNYEVILNENMVYIIGGLTGTGVTNNVFAASINSDYSLGTWNTITSLPSSMYGTTAVIVNNKLYTFGGTNGSTVLNAIYSTPYNDGVNNYITNLTGLNTNNHKNPYTEKIQHEFNTSVNNNSDIVFNTETTTLTNPNSSFDVLLFNKNIYVLGGYSGTNPTNSIYRASLNSGNFNSSFSANTVNLPVNLYSFKSLVLSNKLYVIGGQSTNTTFSNQIYTTTVNSDGLISSPLTSAGTIPTAISDFSVVTTCNKVFLFGGKTFPSANTTNIYSAEINSDGSLSTFITEQITLPKDLHGHESVLVGSYLYIIGGYSFNDGSTSNAVYRCKMSKLGELTDFTLYGYLPVGLTKFEVVTTYNKMYIIGGNNGTSATRDILVIPIQANGNLGTSVDTVTNNINGIDTLSNILPYAVYGHKCFVSSSKLYVIGGVTGGININTIVSSPFNGGRDDYLNFTFNTTPIKVSLPDFSNTDFATMGYNLYIKT